MRNSFLAARVASGLRSWPRIGVEEARSVSRVRSDGEEIAKNLLRRSVTPHGDEEVADKGPLHPATKAPAHQPPRLVGHSQITRLGCGSQLPAPFSDQGNGPEPLLKSDVVESSSLGHRKLPTASAAVVQVSRFEFSLRPAENSQSSRQPEDRHLWLTTPPASPIVFRVLSYFLGEGLPFCVPMSSNEV